MPGPSYKNFKSASPAASRVGQGNRSRDTKPEIMLRKRLWARGLRYRLHRKDLPGRPDLVFPGARIAVFVDGDFWHGRNWEDRKKRLATGANSRYWISKIARNRDRDREQEQALAAAGWVILRFWEGEIREDPEAAAQLIEAAVTSTLLTGVRGLG
jgi:DNA mismatch endonuclease, patch repair protein